MSRRPKYPIRILLMSEKGIEQVVTIDRGHETPADHAFVAKMQRDVVEWIAKRRTAKVKT